MDSPGEYIKRERKLREISLQDVSKAIKVQVKLLKALEADDYDELPHPTFVKGFFRAYAKHLGLDDNDIVLRYEGYRKEFYDDIAQESALPVTFPLATAAGHSGRDTEGPRNKQLIAVAVIAAVVLIAAAYFIFSGPSEVTPLPGGVLPQAAAPVKDDGEGKAPVDADKETPEPVKAAKVNAAGDKKKASANKKPSVLRKEAGKAVKPQVIKKAVKVEPPSRPAAAGAVSGAGHTLVAHANAETWMRVDIDGIKSREVLLQPFETATWSAKKGFSVLLGNAGGVTLTFDGVDMGSPGALGKTVRVRFPEGVELPPVAVKKAAPVKAVKDDKEITPSIGKAVKEAPAEVGIVKDEASSEAEAAKAEVAAPEKDVPVSNEKSPVMPDVVTEPAPETQAETPVVKEAASEEPLKEEPLKEEAAGGQSVDGEVPEDVKDAPAAVEAAGGAPAAPSVEEGPPSDGAAEASSTDAAAPSEEIDLMEDDF